MAAASATLVPKFAFGYKADAQDAVAFIDEKVVAFVAGHNVVVHQTDSKQQKFIAATAKSEGITAMAVSACKRFVAVAERGERAMVNVFDQRTLKRRKRLSSAEVEAESFTSIAFSSDSKLLLTQGGAPDWKLICWAWDKGKAIATTQVSADPKIPVSHCMFNPVDLSMCSATGEGMLRFYRIVDGEFKSLPCLLGDREPEPYTAHAWMVDNPENVVVGTSKGDLLLFTAGELVCALPTAPGNGTAIHAIAPYSKGFLCGCAGGSLYLYVRSDDDGEPYVRAKHFKVPGWEEADLHTLAVSPSEELLAVGTSSQQLLTFHLADADRLREHEAVFPPLVAPLHEAGEWGGAAITGMSVCVRKPIVVTCGTDRTVRVWNYAQMRLELWKRFTDDTLSVAVHPSGFHVLVGFADKLRLMNVLMDDIRQVAALPAKACRECAFSNGGHLFAAVHNNTIAVYNTYTCEQVASLRGHNGRIQRLYWMAGDRFLVSTGLDGGLYQWDVAAGRRECEYVNKQCRFTSAVAAQSAAMRRSTDVYAVGDDATIKKIEFTSAAASGAGGADGGGGGGGQVDREIAVGTRLSQVALSADAGMFFAAVGENRPARPGAVRSYKFPLTGDHFKEYQALSGPVTRLDLSFDDTHLFVAGRDGALMVFDVREPEGRVARRDRDGGAPPSEEILVTRSDLEDRQNQMSELRNKVVELKSQTDYQLHLKDMEHTEKIKEVTDKYMQQVEQDKNHFELLREEKTDLEMEYDETIKQMEEKHQYKLQQMEAEFQKRIMDEVERYQHLVHERDTMQEQQDQAQRSMIEEHKQMVSDVTKQYESQLAQARGQRLKLQEDREHADRQSSEWLAQLEDDIDQEVEEMRSRYEAKLQSERNQMLGYRGENGLMKKRFSALQKEIEDQREEIKQMLEKDKSLYSHMMTLQQEIQRHRDAIRERDSTIGEKEQRIYELKKKNQELEKFKFVLDHKIKSLKQQIDPRDNEIADMKEQIKEMDADLEDYHKCNAQLDLMIGELRQKLDEMQGQIKKRRQRLNDDSGLIKQFRSDLHECAQYIQNPRDLRECITRLYKNHVQEAVTGESVDVDIQREYQRQKEYLEMSVASLKKKLAKDSSLHNADNMRVMQENMTLIRQIHDLRTELNSVKAAYNRAKEAGAGKGRGITRTSSAASGRSGRSGASLPAGDDAVQEETAEQIESQRQYIAELKERIRTLEQAASLSRPTSREKLPPLDGAATGATARNLQVRQ